MHPRYAAALDPLPEPLKSALTPLLSEKTFSGSFTPEQVISLSRASGLALQPLAIALLPLAASCAVTPVSGFNVGAISHGSSGHWYLGTNMEFAGVPLQQTVHAEQSAIIHGWIKGETSLTGITVNYTPCGHCRQFMNEMNSGSTLEITVAGRPTKRLADYLPDAFGPADLQVRHCLFDACPQNWPVTGTPLEQAAIQAANQSYAPYSQAYSGLALLTRHGTIFSGRYAENAAYNPSLPPLQAALIMLNVSGERTEDIQCAVLAEKPQPILSQRPATEATLLALGCGQLSVITL